jgi:hypothetical protein
MMARWYFQRVFREMLLLVLLYVQSPWLLSTPPIATAIATAYIQWKQNVDGGIQNSHIDDYGFDNRKIARIYVSMYN